jgi:hypothetical protein
LMPAGMERDGLVLRILIAAQLLWPSRRGS